MGIALGAGPRNLTYLLQSQKEPFERTYFMKALFALTQ